MSLNGPYRVIAEMWGIGIYVSYVSDEWRPLPHHDIRFIFTDGRVGVTVLGSFSGRFIEIVGVDIKPFALSEEWTLLPGMHRQADLPNAMANVAPQKVLVPFVAAVLDELVLGFVAIEWNRQPRVSLTLCFCHHRRSLFYPQTTMANVRRTGTDPMILRRSARDIIGTLRISEIALNLVPLSSTVRSGALDDRIQEEMKVFPRRREPGFRADLSKNVTALVQLQLWASQVMLYPLVLAGFEHLALVIAYEQFGQVASLRLSGYQSDPRVEALLSNACVSSYPSCYKEGGLPVPEGTSAAVPVVVSCGTAGDEMPQGHAIAAPAVSAYELSDWEETAHCWWNDQVLTDQVATADLAVVHRYRWKRTAEVVLYPFLTLLDRRRMA